MFAFEVNDMTCGHCVGAITRELKVLDPDARVEIDLASHRVQVQPATADADAIAGAIKEAGYTPVPVAAAAAAAAPSGGCGCR